MNVLAFHIWPSVLSSDTCTPSMISRWMPAALEVRGIPCSTSRMVFTALAILRRCLPVLDWMRGLYSYSDGYKG